MTAQVDNALSPHGGTLVNRVVSDKNEAGELVNKCAGVLRIRGQTARELINIAYGFFSPLEGFMNRADVESVCKKMTLVNGYLWSLPIVLDVTDDQLQKMEANEGDYLLLEYHNIPFAVVELEEIYKFDKTYMAQSMFETSEIPDHPGVKQVYALADNFLAGKIWLINEPVFQEPFDKFFFTPEQMREKFHRRHWQRVVAFHSSTVPHMGHEWIMKGAWFQHKAKAVLASCIVGDKRLTDCIDETVVLGHQALQDSGYMRESMHMTSIFLWDKRYAGSREAVVHAIVRKNLGCTGHIFGKNHALPREYVGDTYAAAFVFKHLPEIGIESVPVKEWFFCKHCNGVTYSSFCGHATAKDEFKSENVCSLLSTGIKPTEHLLRPEVFDTIIGAADKYGFGDGYVTEEYLQRRNPIFLLHKF